MEAAIAATDSLLGTTAPVTAFVSDDPYELTDYYLDWFNIDDSARDPSRIDDVTFQDDYAGMHMLGYLDEDRVMWASDDPHPASTWPNSQAVIERQTAHLSPETKRKILSENARQLYGL